MKKQGVFDNKNAIQNAIDKSSSIKEVLINLGVTHSGTTNYRKIKQAAEKFDLELPRFDWGESLARINRKDDAEVFCENSTFNNRTAVKKRLYESGVKEECALCGLRSEWNGKPITLQLDHINGVWNDNRKENLQIVCPNCHSQTETFGSRSTRPDVKKKYFCQCGSEIVKSSNQCQSCATSKRYNIDWPEYDKLKILVKSEGYEAVGRRFGCTGAAVKRRIKKIESELEQQDEV